ncbi:MAG: inositol monophosphatase [Bacteroidota bacterium]
MKLREAFPNSVQLNVDTRALLDVAFSSASQAASIHRERQSDVLQISRKELNDIVTEVDTEAETAILKTIYDRFPSHSIKSEETGDRLTGDDHQWVIDPLDGTVNYAAGNPFYSSSVAVQRNGVTEVGVIVSSPLNEYYVTVRGFGAFLNGSPIRASERSVLSDSTLSFMLTSHYSSAHQDDILHRVSVLSPKVRGLRLYVSQALELGFIACGRLDGHVCIKSRGYSAAAGVLLLREAGGRVTDLHGDEFSNSARSLLASNGLLHDELMALS